MNFYFEEDAIPICKLNKTANLVPKHGSCELKKY